MSVNNGITYGPYKSPRNNGALSSFDATLLVITTKFARVVIHNLTRKSRNFAQLAAKFIALYLVIAELS